MLVGFLFSFFMIVDETVGFLWYFVKIDFFENLKIINSRKFMFAKCKNFANFPTRESFCSRKFLRLKYCSKALSESLVVSISKLIKCIRISLIFFSNNSVSILTISFGCKVLAFLTNKGLLSNNFDAIGVIVVIHMENETGMYRYKFKKGLYHV